MTFARPIGLWGIFGAVAVGALLAAASRRSRRLARSLDPGFRGPGPLRSALLPAVAAALLAVAIARPRWGFRLEAAPGPESDLVVVLDTSGSMLVRDVLPDRFTRARLFVRQTLDSLPPTTRAALVRVEGSGEVVVPPTLDRTAIENALAELSPRGAAAAGSNLAAGIAAARELLETRRSRSRRILLVSDMESLEGRIEAEARACRDAGIVLDVAVTGTAAGGPVPAPGGGFLKVAGNAVVSRANPELARRIARLASGTFANAGAGVVATAPARTGRSPEPTGAWVRVPADRTAWPLSLAMIAWIGWMWPWRGRRPE
jgi:Ca-activated chloride channel family protein